VATGFYGFHGGKFSDDWAVSLRVPETDAYQWPASPFIRWNYFWRPVHLLAVCGMGTVFWHRDWISHLVVACVHLGVGVLLYAFLRRAELGRVAAACALCAFLVSPISMEAVLWPSAIGSVAGVGCLIMVASALVSRWSARKSPDDARPGRGLFFFCAAGFLIACWHEQPAGAVISLPLLFLAVRPEGTDPVPSARWAWSPIAACCCGVLAYIALFVATVPSSSRGGAQTLVRAKAIGRQVVRLVEMTWDLSFGVRARESMVDAFRIGSHAVSHTPWGLGAIVLLAVLAAAWVLGLGNAPADPGSHAGYSPRRTARLFWLAVFGLALGASSMLPIALVSYQPLWSRHLYGLSAGLAIALAAGLEAAVAALRGHSSRPGRKERGFLVMAALAPVAIAAAVCCVGWQTEFRDRYLADVDQMNQLRALVPDPPRGAVFVPISLGDGKRAGLRTFDPGIYGALANHCSCWAYVQRGYGRSDLSATHLVPWQSPPVTADEAGITYPRGFCDAWGRTSPERRTVPWSLVIPIRTDKSGKVGIVDTKEAKAALARPRQ
jgi:hypothetical protein